jgi:hypothetical protein
VKISRVEPFKLYTGEEMSIIKCHREPGQSSELLIKNNKFQQKQPLEFNQNH